MIAPHLATNVCLAVDTWGSANAFHLNRRYLRAATVVERDHARRVRLSSAASATYTLVKGRHKPRNIHAGSLRLPSTSAARTISRLRRSLWRQFLRNGRYQWPLARILHDCAGIRSGPRRGFGPSS
jgi:hypothetical protein